MLGFSIYLAFKYHNVGIFRLVLLPLHLGCMIMMDAIGEICKIPEFHLSQYVMLEGADVAECFCIQCG